MELNPQKVTSIIFVFIYGHLVDVGERKLLRMKKSWMAKGREQQMLTKYQKFLDVITDMLAGQKKQLQWRSMHIYKGDTRLLFYRFALLCCNEGSHNGTHLLNIL